MICVARSSPCANYTKYFFVSIFFSFEILPLKFRRALFWRVDEEEFDTGLDLFQRHAINALGNAQKRRQSEGDIQLIQKAIEHM